jgi:D-amino-acid dehydrogenase
MEIAVIGAGVVGTSTAYELALDGHAVTLFDRNASIAEGASFANGCQLAPSVTQALSHPLWPAGAMTGIRRFFGSVEIQRGATLRDINWLLSWSKTRPPNEFSSVLRAQQLMLTHSLERMQAMVQATTVDFDRCAGQMLLFESERDAKDYLPKLELLKEIGVVNKLLTPQEAYALEPGMGATATLHSAVHFPNDEAGNCRQFAQQIKEEAQKLGVKLRLGATVSAIRAASKPALVLSGQPAPIDFDRIVLCTGDDPGGFLHALHIKASCAQVQSYSLSLPVREPLNAPRSALFDVANRISITRNGAWLRVSGGAELGNAKGRHTEKSVRRLYAALQNRFPGAANFRQGGQTWRGSSLFSGDALPLIGPTPVPGVFLNMAHGHNGWGMACGAARLVADLIANRATAVDASPYNPMRFGT